MEDPLWACMFEPAHPWDSASERWQEVFEDSQLGEWSVAELCAPGPLPRALTQSVEDPFIDAAPRQRALGWWALLLHTPLSDPNLVRQRLSALHQAVCDAPMDAALWCLCDSTDVMSHKALSGLPAAAHNTLAATIGQDGWITLPVLRELALYGRAAPAMAAARLLAQERMAGPWSAQWTALRFIDAVEGGRVMEASEMVVTPERLYHNGMDDRLLQAYTALAWIQEAILASHPLDPDAVLRGPQAIWRQLGDSPWAVVLERILLSLFGTHDELEQVYDMALPTVPGGHGAQLPVRLALAAHRPDNALRLVRKRQQWCADAASSALALRAYLAQADLATARSLGRELLRVMHVFDCRGRIEFEMHHAGELGKVDLLALLADQEPASVDAARSLSTSATSHGHGLLGESQALAQVRTSIDRYAPVALPVLICGPSGSGKELVATALHQASSRAAQPFVPVNCAALAESLLESELFGHVRGAFSGAVSERRGLVEAAGSGTLFLDEIGDCHPHLQAALLRLLEGGDYRRVGSEAPLRARCRIIAATNVDLAAQVRAGVFREDLYYRIGRLTITVPALTTHSGDIPDLARHLLQSCTGAKTCTFSDDFIAWLQRQPWPGNVRQLRNGLETMALLHPGRSHFTLAQYRAVHNTDVVAPPPAPRDGGSHTVRVGRSKTERLVLLEALLERRGQLTRVEAARELGISPMTATAYLRTLCASGRVRKVMPNAAPRSHYFTMS